MKRFNRARLAWLLALVIGCGESSAASVEIGAAGGEFAPAGTNATLTIPEGALTSNTKLTAEAFATDDIELPERGATVVSQVVRFSPEGVVFAEPATLTFTIDAADLPEGGSPTQLVIARAFGDRCVRIAADGGAPGTAHRRDDRSTR